MTNKILKNTAATQSGLAAIRNAFENATELRLFATDIQLNIQKEQYYTAATAGECVPVAYDEAGIAAAFFAKVIQVATEGQDVPQNPPMRISDVCKVLLFTRNGFTPKNEANVIVKPIPETMSDEVPLLATIEEEIIASDAKIVIFDDVTGYDTRNGRLTLWDLNELAYNNDVIILAGFMLDDEAEETSYLATHAHNLWQLAGGSLNIKNDDGETSREQRYFCFSYGRPEPKRVYYGLDEQGNACIVRDMAKLIRIRELANNFASQPISLKLFKHVAFGALQGEFIKGSIEKAVSVAANNDVIQISGSGKKTMICCAGGKMSRKPYTDNIALTAKGNPYTSPKHTKKRKPILKHGEFKLLVSEKGITESVMQRFAIDMMGTVATGKKWLDFDVKTPYRNTLAILIGGKESGTDWLKERIAEFGEGAKFNAMVLPNEITDADFITTYEQAVETHKPDFVFVLCYDRIKADQYTEKQLVEEIAAYSKKKGICTIAERFAKTANYSDDLTGDEYWRISPLISQDVMEDILKETGMPLSHIYNFQGSDGSFDFLCRFGWATGNDVAAFASVPAKKQQELFLIGTFYRCDQTPCWCIENDCTGQPLTGKVVYAAEREGIIRMEKTDKNGAWRKSLITFIG